MSDNNTRYITGVPRLHLLLSTGCGLGFVPVAPATAAGFVGLVAWYVAYLLLPVDTLFIVTATMIVLTTIVGIWTTNVMERYWGPDPRAVVIDEFVGTWIPLLIAPASPFSPANSQFLILNSQFSILNSQLSILNSQLSILNSQLSTINYQLSTAIYALIAFALFRIIDIYKPLGCRWIDRNVKGGLGCVLDDILAGIYALIILFIIKTIL